MSQQHTAPSSNDLEKDPRTLKIAAFTGDEPASVVIRAISIAAARIPPISVEEALDAGVELIDDLTAGGMASL